MRTIEEIMGCLESCYGNESCSTGNHRCPYGDEGVIDCVDRLKVDYERIMAAIAKVSTLDRLEEICNAEREGRCVVLPCKVGDTIIAFRYTAEKGLHYLSDKVTAVTTNRNGYTVKTQKVFYPIKQSDGCDFAPISELPYALADYYIGTPEEAEQAIKERGQNG